MPEPQQCRIQAASTTYTIAHSNTRSLIHWVRPGIEPATSWFLVRFVSAEPRWELWFMNLFKADSLPLPFSLLIFPSPSKFQWGAFFHPSDFRSAHVLVIRSEQLGSLCLAASQFSTGLAQNSSPGACPLPALGCTSPWISITTALTTACCHYLLNCLP